MYCTCLRQHVTILYIYLLLFKLTHIFPTEAASSSRAVRVQVAVGKVTLLVEPQPTLVIVHYLLPVGTFYILVSQFKYQTQDIHLVL